MRKTTMEDLYATKTIDWDTFTDVCCHLSDYDKFCKNEDHKEYDAYLYGAECHFSVCPIWNDLDEVNQ